MNDIWKEKLSRVALQMAGVQTGSEYDYTIMEANKWRVLSYC